MAGVGNAWQAGAASASVWRGAPGIRNRPPMIRTSSVASVQGIPAMLTVSYRRLTCAGSGRKHLEHPHLLWSRCHEVAACLGVDLSCVPMLSDHAGGDAGSDASGGLRRVDVPRVEQEHGLDAPWPREMPRDVPAGAGGPERTRK